MDPQSIFPLLFAEKSQVDSSEVRRGYNQFYATDQASWVSYCLIDRTSPNETPIVGVPRLQCKKFRISLRIKDNSLAKTSARHKTLTRRLPIRQKRATDKENRHQILNLNWKLFLEILRGIYLLRVPYHTGRSHNKLFELEIRVAQLFALAIWQTEKLHVGRTFGPRFSGGLTDRSITVNFQIRKRQKITETNKNVFLKYASLRIRIRCLFDPWIRDPE